MKDDLGHEPISDLGHEQINGLIKHQITIKINLRKLKKLWKNLKTRVKGF